MLGEALDPLHTRPPWLFLWWYHLFSHRQSRHHNSHSGRREARHNLCRYCTFSYMILSVLLYPSRPLCHQYANPSLNTQVTFLENCTVSENALNEFLLLPPLQVYKSSTRTAGFLTIFAFDYITASTS